MNVTIFITHVYNSIMGATPMQWFRRRCCLKIFLIKSSWTSGSEDVVKKISHLVLWRLREEDAVW